jgi:hypothetical protein
MLLYEILYVLIYSYNDLKTIFEKVHQDYADRSLQITTKDGGFQNPKTLAQILGYETSAGSVGNDNKNIDESKII